MKANLTEIKEKTAPINHYIQNLKQPFYEKFLTRKKNISVKTRDNKQTRKIRKEGEEIGKIIENPGKASTLEEELLKIMLENK